MLPCLEEIQIVHERGAILLLRLPGVQAGVPVAGTSGCGPLSCTARAADEGHTATGAQRAAPGRSLESIGFMADHRHLSAPSAGRSITAGPATRQMAGNGQGTGRQEKVRKLPIPRQVKAAHQARDLLLTLLRSLCRALTPASRERGFDPPRFPWSVYATFCARRSASTGVR